MSDYYDQFERIREAMVGENEDVATGKMMSSEAITYKQKVFAFFGRDKVMCFKLGREFDAEAHGITSYKILAPFKNKKPMLDWFLIDNHTQWENLSRLALERMQDQLDS